MVLPLNGNGDDDNTPFHCGYTFPSDLHHHHDDEYNIDFDDDDDDISFHFCVTLSGDDGPGRDEHGGDDDDKWHL